MKTRKEKLILLSLSFVSMVLLGLILNTYDLLRDEKIIDITTFNKILIKSTVISFVILIVIVLLNYKKIKSE